MTKIPTLKKMEEIQPFSQKIGDFLDFMANKGYYMCEFIERDDYDIDIYSPTFLSREQMLAMFFDIDLVEAEKERQALLDSIKE